MVVLLEERNLISLKALKVSVVENASAEFLLNTIAPLDPSNRILPAPAVPRVCRS